MAFTRIRDGADGEGQLNAALERPPRPSCQSHAGSLLHILVVQQAAGVGAVLQHPDGRLGVHTES